MQGLTPLPPTPGSTWAQAISYIVGCFEPQVLTSSGLDRVRQGVCTWGSLFACFGGQRFHFSQGRAPLRLISSRYLQGPMALDPRWPAIYDVFWGRCQRWPAIYVVVWYLWIDMLRSRSTWRAINNVFDVEVDFDLLCTICYKIMFMKTSAAASAPAPASASAPAPAPPSAPAPAKPAPQTCSRFQQQKYLANCPHREKAPTQDCSHGCCLSEQPSACRDPVRVALRPGDVAGHSALIWHRGPWLFECGGFVSFGACLEVSEAFSNLRARFCTWFGSLVAEIWFSAKNCAHSSCRIFPYFEESSPMASVIFFVAFGCCFNMFFGHFRISGGRNQILKICAYFVWSRLDVLIFQKNPQKKMRVESSATKMHILWVCANHAAAGKQKMSHCWGYEVPADRFLWRALRKAFPENSLKSDLNAFIIWSEISDLAPYSLRLSLTARSLQPMSKRARTQALKFRNLLRFYWFYIFPQRSVVISRRKLDSIPEICEIFEISEMLRVWGGMDLLCTCFFDICSCRGPVCVCVYTRGSENAVPSTRWHVEIVFQEPPGWEGGDYMCVYIIW